MDSLKMYSASVSTHSPFNFNILTDKKHNCTQSRKKYITIQTYRKNDSIPTYI